MILLIIAVYCDKHVKNLLKRRTEHEKKREVGRGG